MGWLWCGFGVALVWPWGWLCTPESMPSICLVYGFVVALDGFVPGVGAGSPSCFLRSENSDSSTYCPFAPGKPGCPPEGRGRMASGPETQALAISNLWSVFRRPSPTPARTSREASRARPTSKTAARPNESDPWCAGCRHPAARYTNTSTAAFSADFTTSSNLRSLVLGSLSLAATSGTDSIQLRRSTRRIARLCNVRQTRFRFFGHFG